MYQAGKLFVFLLLITFVSFAGGEKEQQIIRNFGKDRFGDAIYNDAEYARKELENGG